LYTSVTGLLKLIKGGSGILRDPAFPHRPGPKDAYVPAGMVRRHFLSEGCIVEGLVKPGRKLPELHRIDKISGMNPDEYSRRTPFARLAAVDPSDRFDFSDCKDRTLRVLDLVSPIGKGTRALIVSPPRAGKTTLIEKMARAIREKSPDTRLVLLLIDERPEEVTHFRRIVDAEVLSSSNDDSPATHTELTNLTLNHIRNELECGREVVVLVDSMTRIGRAFNMVGSGTGRTMSGGMEAGALEIPRRFFGMARNIEGGGSVTILATALVDTGSRMDQLIFEEFKGTGNSELVLNRELADQRLFPAIDIRSSGTRKEELLYRPDEIDAVRLLRRRLAAMAPKQALESLLEMVHHFPTNKELLEYIRKQG
jgi:transcription termination factor Rho